MTHLRNMKTLTLLLLISFSQLAQAQLNCLNARTIISFSSDNHYTQNNIDEKAMHNTAKMYIDIIDSSNMILTKADIKALETKLKNKKFFNNFKSNTAFSLIFGSEVMIEEYKKVGCDFLEEVNKTLLKGLERQENLLSKIEAKKIKVTKNEKVISAPEHRFKTESELTKFLNKYMTIRAENDRIPQLKERIQSIKTEIETNKYENLVESFVKTLDPHSDYFSNEKAKDYMYGLSNQLNGFGFVFEESKNKEGLRILEVIKGSSVEKSQKFKPNDFVIAIDGADIKGMTLKEASELLNNKNLVNFTRQDKTVVTLERKKIVLDQIDKKVIKKDNYTLFYVKPKSFYSNYNAGDNSGLASEFKKAFEDASSEKIDAIILDLRNNPGGYIDQAVDLAGFFIGSNLVVKEVSGLKYNDSDYVAVSPALDIKQKLIVLTNQFSASASEIFAGVIKDYNRGIIVGDKTTYGKGSIQQIIDLDQKFENGGSLKLTKSLYFLPSGNTPQLTGVNSDIIIPSLNQKKNFLTEAQMPYVIKDNKKIKTEDVPSFNQASKDLIEKLKLNSRLRISNNEKFKNLDKNEKESEALILEEAENIALDYLKESTEKEVVNVDTEQ